MREEATTIRARDGYPLSATIVQPDDVPRRALVVNGATGVPKEFYRRFDRYAAEQGSAVLLYDYRGIGGSRPASLRGFTATMRDWGAQDMSGALDWLHATYAGLPLVAVGHSVGGQLLGLMPNHGLLHAAVLVTVSTGHWRGMPPSFGLYTLAMLRVVFPLTAGVAREWAAWCLHPRYLAGFYGKTVQRTYYDEVRTPLLWLTFGDDPIATPRNVPAMQAFYRGAPIVSRVIRP
ncbi:MAG: alpha/beta fold hydrolase, partial [Chloroflexales bacterium]|nr:alpha/beta fold hydrolase [Chloroflexales bacterium]